MSSIRCIDFYDLCRICTASSDQKTNVFSAEGRTKNLTMKIAECLSLNVDEKDRLPKVICAQCVQYVEHMFEFRNICNNSQAMLNSCLDTATTQNGGKVYIKDAISGTGKSLSVLGGNGNLPTVTPAPAATLTLQTPIQSAPTSIQNTLQSSDLLTTIMQAVGGLKPGVNQQYTITVDNKSAQSNAPVEYKIEAVPISSTISSDSNILKSEKQSVLEEFIKLKPDIKITPLSKKKPPQQTVSHIQIQQALPEQQNQQQDTLQIQLPQQIQQLQQQLQQQQLQQQIQELTSQWQAQQQLSITAPTTLTGSGTSSTQLLRNNTPLTTTTAEELSPSKSKKPKFNFVLTSPQSQTFTAALPQPQIKLELQPTTMTAQKQTSQSLNAATLLSNLGTPKASSGNVLSPNKCFLPITIRDENSDQQIVAHIDAKNFVFPTTYQVQMKLQRELATADGQSIMQFSPTSIPATLQLTPQTITNPTFQTDIQSQLRPFIIEKPPQQQQHQLQTQYQPPQQEQRQPQQQQQHQPQQQQQHQPQQQQQQHQPQKLQQLHQHQPQQHQPQQQRQPQQHQPQHQPQQQQQLPQKRQTAEVTSHQIIRTSNYPQPLANITQVNSTNRVSYHGNALKVEENKQLKTTVQKQEKVKIKEKYKLLQQRSPNVFEIMPTTNFTQQIMEQVKQQQLQKQQAKQQEMNAQTETKQVISPTQHPGLTVQRVQTKATTAATKSLQAATTSIVGSGSNPPKLPILNKQNITISRITSQNTQQKQQQQQNVAQKQTTSVKIVQQQQKPKVSPPVSQQQPHPQRQQQHQQYIQTQKSTNSAMQQVPPATAKLQDESPSFKKDTDKPMPSKLETTTTATNVATNNTNATTPDKSESTSSDATQKESPSGSSSAASNQHTCQTCGRGFKKKEHLTQHAKLHAGLRPFKCTEENCNKAFSRKEHLMRHCVSHTGKKMFSCDICSKPFSRKDNLNKHRRVHNSQTTELIYKCEICQKSFAVKAYYDKHKEMHKKPAAGESKAAAGTAIKQNEKATQPQSKPLASSSKTESSTQKPQTQRLHVLQTSTTTSQTSQTTSQQQVMHVQLQPQVVTTQDLAGNTITITQASDSNMPTSLANFMQLGYSQFQNSTPGQIVCTIEK